LSRRQAWASATTHR